MWNFCIVHAITHTQNSGFYYEYKLLLYLQYSVIFFFFLGLDESMGDYPEPTAPTEAFGAEEPTAPVATYGDQQHGYGDQVHEGGHGYGDQLADLEQIMSHVRYCFIDVKLKLSHFLLNCL